ncbi:MAG: hypothetical protein AMXMBFR8_27720 [Nevskiales bacterium]
MHMFQRLNAWQKFWGLFAIVFLISTLVLAVSTWPRRDPDVVADLRAPECSSWREIEEGQIPVFQPEPGQPCYALGQFLFHERTVVRSESDYDRARFRVGVRKSLTFLAIWAGFMGSIYVLGVAGVGAKKVLVGRKGPQAGQ